MEWHGWDCTGHTDYRTRGDALTITDGSFIGDRAVVAQAPQPRRNPRANSSDDFFIYSNPSTIKGRYWGNSVSNSKAMAIANLITVGVPASGMWYKV